MPDETRQRIGRYEIVAPLDAGGMGQVYRAWDLFFGYTKTVTGRNTHATDRGLSLILSWSFGRPGNSDEPLASRDGRQGSLVRCVCEKNTGA